MNMFLRLPFLYASLFVLLSAAAPARAVPFDSLAPYAVLMDAETGTILYEKEPHKPVPPSSMTKLMTIYILLEHVAKGIIKLTDTFIVSKEAWRMGGSKMFLKVSDRVTVDDLLHGIIVQSGNDACIVAAEGIASTETAFARLMNDAAKRIGLENSHFENASGWPAPGHVMSVFDIALLSRRLIADFPEYYPYFAAREFTYSDIVQHNRNRLLFRDVGVDGLKTGHTAEGGYGIAASAKQGDRRLIAVVNGLANDRERTDETEKLLQYGFRYFDNKTLFGAEEKVGAVPVWLGAKSTVDAKLAGPVRAVVSKAGAPMKIDVRMVYSSPVNAPVKKGDKIAELHVGTGAGAAAVYPLYAGDSVERASIGMSMLKRAAYYFRSLMDRRP
jgi:D-alanyl-D-alanine carboxypeptidase (penicillin-binding protein 5/6)